MVAVRSLADSDVAAIRGELSEGKPSTVWFTPAAVGVPVGGSAKVVSVGEVEEGEFIQVRPAGSRDMMFCSPSELTRARPARKPKRAPEVPQPAAVPEAVSKPTEKSGPERAETEKPAVERSATEKPAIAEGGRAATGANPTPPAPPVRRAPERRASPAEVTVTLFASTEGEWTVEVLVGKKRVVRLLPVQPGDVAKAARFLPAPVTEAIEASLAEARKRQTERVEQLRAELEAAQQALRELSG